MVRPFRIFWVALCDLMDELWVLMACNVLWSLIGLPLLLLTLVLFSQGFVWPPIVAGLLAVLPLATATAGLYSVAQRISEGRACHVRDFFVGMRRYMLPGWYTAGLWSIGLLVILVNLQFYARLPNLFGIVLTGFWLVVLLIWLCMLVYMFPLLLIQPQTRWWVRMRYAFALAMGRPLFTLVTLILMLFLVLLTALVPVLSLVVTVVLLAQWSMRATLLLLEEAEAHRAAANSTVICYGPLTDKGHKGQIRPE